MYGAGPTGAAVAGGGHGAARLVRLHRAAAPDDNACPARGARVALRSGQPRPERRPATASSGSFVYPGRYDGNKSAAAALAPAAARATRAPTRPSTGRRPGGTGDRRAPVGEYYDGSTCATAASRPTRTSRSAGRAEPTTGRRRRRELPARVRHPDSRPTGFAGPPARYRRARSSATATSSRCRSSARTASSSPGSEHDPRIRPSEVLEMNALPMDAAFAEDTDLHR